MLRRFPYMLMMLRDTPYSKADIKDISLEAKEYSLQ